jgi:hypothetical protein
MNTIPVMDDPLGKYWDQPNDIRKVLMDDKSVILSKYQIANLAEYSSTFPSGVYPGKCWKRIERNKMYLVWYGDETPKKECPILFREILVI